MALRTIQLRVESVAIGSANTFAYPADGADPSPQIYLIPTYSLIVTGSDGTGRPISSRFEVLRFGVHRASKAVAPSVVGLADQQTHTIKAWIPTYAVHSAVSAEKGAWQVYDNFLIHDGPDNLATDVYATIGCIEICGPTGFVKFNDLVANLSGSAKTSLAEKLAEVGRSGKMVITYNRATRPALTKRP